MPFGYLNDNKLCHKYNPDPTLLNITFNFMSFFHIFQIFLIEKSPTIYSISNDHHSQNCIKIKPISCGNLLACA